MLTKNITKPLITFIAIFFLISCVNEDDTSTTPSYAIYGFDITCSNSQDCMNSPSTLNGKKARVGWTKDSCPAGSSTTFLSIGTGTITCTGSAPNGNCTASVANYSTAELEEGNYNVLVYFDTNDNGFPNTGEPGECATGLAISSSTSGSTQNHTLNDEL